MKTHDESLETAAPRFGHPPAVKQFWRRLVPPLVEKHPTPFFVFSCDPVRDALGELDRHFGKLPVRHWLSFKTLTLPPFIQWWRRQGRPVEVVSEFELRAALQEGFAPARILINGPAKHHWLPRHPVPGLHVNFDSVNEAIALIPLARKLGWSLGLRLRTSQEHDSEHVDFPTQFGVGLDEVKQIVRKAGPGLRFDTVHFHLRSHIATAEIYAKALGDVAAICRAAGITPRHVDVGGGFPTPWVVDRNGNPMNTGFNLPEMARVIRRAMADFPGVREFWMENGRWLSARAGVLVTGILDVKQQGPMRHLICDGGRMNNALVSIWEAHEILSLPDRVGKRVPTVVNGPACTAFDQLARRPMPAALREGDVLIWMEAGAYHVAWENRFTRGLPALFWHDGSRVRVARKAEAFEQWYDPVRPQKTT